MRSIPFPCPVCGAWTGVTGGHDTDAGFLRQRACKSPERHTFSTVPDDQGGEVVYVGPGRGLGRRNNRRRLAIDKPPAEPEPERRDFPSEPAVFDTAGLIHFLYGAYRAGSVNGRLPRYVHEYAQEVRAAKGAA